MRGTDLREAMQGLVEQQPPMQEASADDLRRGRRSVTRRRWGAGLAGVACAGIAAVTVTSYDNAPPDDASVIAATPDEQSVLERCQALGAPVLDGRWGDGDTVVTWDTAAGQVDAIVLSADRSRWASCWLENQQGNGLFEVYAMDGARVPHSEFSYNADLEVGTFTMVERFPSDVASLRLTFDGGETRTVPAVDGFVVASFDDLPPGANLDAVRLYDVDGVRLAGPEDVGGDASLPPAYRSLTPEPLASTGEAENL
jgi:hypothetical protein